MLTRIDHVMICVPELSAGIEAYRRIGFDIYPGGEHAGRGTHNAIAFHGEDYLELLSPRPGGPAPGPTAPRPGSPSSCAAERASATSRSRATTWSPTWRPCARAASR